MISFCDIDDFQHSFKFFLQNILDPYVLHIASVSILKKDKNIKNVKFILNFREKIGPRTNPGPKSPLVFLCDIDNVNLYLRHFCCFPFIDILELPSFDNKLVLS